MIVCPCDEIDDATIRQLIRQGATRIEQIVSACSVGAYCGACVPFILQILRHEKHLVERTKKRASSGK
jgi:bacterioferritin-associated ferredoxin